MAPVVTPEITSNIRWISQMNVDVEPAAGRKTTVIGTIGKNNAKMKNPTFFINFYSQVLIQIVLK